MSSPVNDYANSKKGLFKFFKCPDDYFVRCLENARWEITENEGIYFLSYSNNGTDKVTAVVIKKNDEPLTYTAQEYTMVIAIDCVKIAFIFSNRLKKLP
ncbi:MAG: hypothetical protein LBU94_00425 [Clostridiales bacterium]|jgi:hypothetical protein|nr:hypothetical protein [Clostridiales bacterium]